VRDARVHGRRHLAQDVTARLGGAVGAARSCYEAAVDYSRTRVQFDKPNNVREAIAIARQARTILGRTGSRSNTR
jgi:alkylation response protein AidB-like acyl-CoA dehydrogenase